MLHWTRIGGLAAAKGDNVELSDFFTAWKNTGLEKSDWMTGNTNYYPTHGILRRMAMVYAACQEPARVTEVLRLLRALVQSSPSVLFRLIEAAAILQSAGLIGQYDLPDMQRRLSGGKSDINVAKLLDKLATNAEATQPRIALIVKAWIEVNSKISENTAEPQLLIEAGKVVGY